MHRGMGVGVKIRQLTPPYRASPSTATPGLKSDYKHGMQQAQQQLHVLSKTFISFSAETERSLFLLY